MQPDFNSLLTTFQMNMCPAMAEALADQLGPAVTAEAITKIGIGYYPVEEAWIFPERDATGNVVGLTKRYRSGKKLAWKGAKRGLTYECMGTRTKDGYMEERRMVRVNDADVPCPICGREGDGCMVSNEDPEDPAAVICVREPKGAVKRMDSGCGYLHHRKPHTRDRGRPVAILPVSDRPTVITEGASDALVAISLGFVAVSVPAAGASSSELADLVRGRDLILVGDRDARGVGQSGLEALFLSLKPAAKSIVKVLPPEPFKDLRQWAPDLATFEQHVGSDSTDQRDDGILDSAESCYLIDTWLKDTQMYGGNRILHEVHGDRYRWEGCRYQKVDKEELHNWWYDWMGEHRVSFKKKDGVELHAITMDSKRIRNLELALGARIHIKVDEGAHEPLVLNNRKGHSMEMTHAIVFKNGIYYVREDKLMPLTPDIFLTSTLPYGYDIRRKCEEWLWFVADIFNGDEECIALLQEWMGYCLIASNHLQAMMFFYGVPGSGKSTVARVIEAMLGEQRATSADTNTFRSLFGPGKLLNKYLAIMSESRDTDRGAIDRLLQQWKAITGGDRISVNRKYRDAVDARLFCRLLYVANDVLPFDDTSQAMAGRTNLLYFPNNYRLNNPDRELPHRLMAEAPGIVLWAIEGLRRLLETGKFTTPAASVEHLDGIAELTNPVGLMLSECCTFHVGQEFFDNRIECERLYAVWVAWCKVTCTKNSLSRQAFFLRMRNLPHPLIKKRVVINGKRTYVYEGISLKDHVMKDYLGE